MDSNPTSLWIAAAAHYLHQHWRTVDAAQLEETARELQCDPELSVLAPADAVARWLAPACAKPAGETDSTDVWGRFASPSGLPF